MNKAIIYVMQINFIDIFLSTTETIHIRLSERILNVDAWYAGLKKQEPEEGFLITSLPSKLASRTSYSVKLQYFPLL